MLFSKSYKLTSRNTSESLKSKLIGKIIQIKNLNFEIYESEKKIKIIPLTEKVEDAGILPITHVNLDPKGDTTDVNVSYKIRKLDQGGAYLIVIACAFLFIGSFIFYFNSEELIALILFSISLIIFATFWIKMRSGYFDYAHKIRTFLNEISVA